MKNNHIPATREDILNNRYFYLNDRTGLVFRLMPASKDDKFGNQWIGIKSKTSVEFPFVKIIKIGKKKITFFYPYYNEIRKSRIDDLFLVEHPKTTAPRPIRVTRATSMPIRKKRKLKMKIYED